MQIARARILSAAQEVDAQLRAEFERLMRTDPQAAMSPALGFANHRGELGPDGFAPSAMMKYVADAESYIRRFYAFLPFFAGLEKVYELGVGPGYLLLMLREVLGIDARGCDIGLADKAVFREVRRALGLEPHVEEFAVRASFPLPVEPGTQAICAFYTVFNDNWGVAEHQWFLEECRRVLSGPKLVILRLNPHGFTDRPEVFDFYHARADFPLPDEGFCILDA